MAAGHHRRAYGVTASAKCARLGKATPALPPASSTPPRPPGTTASAPSTPRANPWISCNGCTGTTGEAAWREGCRAILIEREEEYQQDIARRMELAEKPTKRAAVAKTKNKLEQAHEMPLFASLEAAE